MNGSLMKIPVWTTVDGWRGVCSLLPAPPSPKAVGNTLLRKDQPGGLVEADERLKTEAKVTHRHRLRSSEERQEDDVTDFERPNG